MYIILTVIQFGAVHHFTKLGSGEFYPEELEDEISFSKRGHKQVEEIFANLRQRRASDALCFMLRKVGGNIYNINILIVRMGHLYATKQYVNISFLPGQF